MRFALVRSRVTESTVGCPQRTLPWLADVTRCTAGMWGSESIRQSSVAAEFLAGRARPAFRCVGDRRPGFRHPHVNQVRHPSNVVPRVPRPSPVLPAAASSAQSARCCSSLPRPRPTGCVVCRPGRSLAVPAPAPGAVRTRCRPAPTSSCRRSSLREHHVGAPWGRASQGRRPADREGS